MKWQENVRFIQLTTKAMKTNMFDKIKRIIALIGVIVLVCLYALTFFFALTDSTNTMYYFKMALFSTILFPVLLFVYISVYKWLKSRNDKDDK